MKIIKKIVYSMCLIYTIDLIIYNFNITIPINIFTVAFVALTDALGIIGIVLLKIVLEIR